MKPWRVAVIGLGQIGQGYDYPHPLNKDTAVTHASACATHPSYKLVAGIDPQTEKRQAFESKFLAPAFSKLEDYDGPADIFVIATATKLHEAVLSSLLSRNPKAVICEKPLSFSILEAEAMVEKARAKDIPLLVNYMRRFEPGVLELRRRLRSGAAGEIYKGRVWYSKGLYNNGSHFIDLLQFLLGDCNASQVIQGGRKWQSEDPEPDFVLKFGAVEIYFLSAREECFSVAEFELMGTKGRVLYLDGGLKIEFHSTTIDPTFPTYTVLSPTPEMVPNEFSGYQWHVLDHLQKHLADGRFPLNSTGETALSTLRVIEKLTRS